MNLGLLKVILLALFFFKHSLAEPIQMKYAKFKLLDKISNKLSEKTIPVDSSDYLGTLSINVYSCFSTPPDEIPENYVLIDVADNFQEINKSIYRGWMISSSPDVTPLEHPIYDLWLLGCSNDNTS